MLLCRLHFYNKTQPLGIAGIGFCIRWSNCNYLITCQHNIYEDYTKIHALPLSDSPADNSPQDNSLQGSSRSSYKPLFIVHKRNQLPVKPMSTQSWDTTNDIIAWKIRPKQDDIEIAASVPKTSFLYSCEAISSKNYNKIGRRKCTLRSAVLTPVKAHKRGKYKWFEYAATNAVKTYGMSGSPIMGFAEGKGELVLAGMLTGAEGTVIMALTGAEIIDYLSPKK